MFQTFRNLFASRRDATLDALIERATGSPLALFQPKVAELSAALTRRTGGERLDAGAIAALRADWKAATAKHRQPRAQSPDEPLDDGEPVRVHREGDALELAVVEIRGALVKGAADWRASVGMVGYSDIEDALASVYADRNTRAILAVIDSPGGETAGLLECMDRIAEWKAERPDVPVGVFMDGLAASGGYALAAALADPGWLWAFDSAIIGNVGVYRIVVDESGALAKRGVAVHIAQFPDRKTIGNPLRALTDDDRGFHDSRVREVAAMLIERVAKARGVEAAAIEGLRGEWRNAQYDDGTLVDAIGRVEHAADAMLIAAGEPPQEGPAPKAPAKPRPAQQPSPVPPAPPRPPTDAPSDDDEDEQPPQEPDTMPTASLSTTTRAKPPAAPPAPGPRSRAAAPRDPLALDRLTLDPADDWRRHAAIRGAYRAAYPSLPKDRSERAFTATGRSILAERKGAETYRVWLADLVSKHRDAALAAVRAQPPAAKLSGDPRRDWAENAQLRGAYANRYGDKPTNEQAFLRTGEAFLNGRGGAGEYAAWAADLIARHAEY